jgi:heme oxygenase
MMFCTYLKTARAHDNFRGDFINDAADDRGLHKRNPQTLDDLLSYLRYERNACREALQGAKAAWRSYREWLKRRAGEPTRRGTPQNY